MQATAPAESSVGAAALTYAARWAVFPLAGKVPRTPHGLKDATTSAEQIREWWQRWPGAGAGIRTGRESGLIVLDVDHQHGGDDTLHELEQMHGELPLTPRVITGGGGEHHYFRHPGGVVRNSAGAVGPGLDVRGDGGYVVAPPSPHPSGRRYEWDVPPDEAELTAAPRWLLDKLTQHRNGHARPVSEWRRLAAAGVGAGERNERTAQLAGHLLVRNIDPFVALELVVAWDAQRNRPPLGREEVTRTVDSIARREARKWTG
jgi:Bifunctional DNA primase/polymerase, N-terminal/Primase C terminal 1 (PriCT-1)